MKTLSKLKLTQINHVELREKEMNQLKGGESCGCGCHYTSSDFTNGNTNWNYGYSQSSGGNKQCASWGDIKWSEKF